MKKHEAPKREHKLNPPHQIKGESLINHEHLQNALQKLQSIELKEMDSLQATGGRILIYAKGAGTYMGSAEAAEKWFENYYNREDGKGDHGHFNLLLRKHKQEPLTIEEFRSYFFQMALSSSKQAK